VAISFPTSLDNFTNPSSGNTLDSPSHSLQHSDINDAVEAMQRKVGVGTAVAGSASAGQVLTISAAGTSTWSGQGLTQIIPTSVAVGSGSGSVDANGAVTFTGASSISLNGAFTATHQNYRIVVDITASSNNCDFGMKFRNAGSDLTNAYYGGFIGLNHSGTTVTFALNNAASIKLTEFNTFTKQAGYVDISVGAPFLTSTASVVWSSVGVQSSTGTGLGGSGGVGHDTAGTRDGFSLIASAGTIAGIIRVYGYKN